jgi:hypothetical protein
VEYSSVTIASCDENDLGFVVTKHQAATKGYSDIGGNIAWALKHVCHGIRGVEQLAEAVRSLVEDCEIDMNWEGNVFDTALAFYQAAKNHIAAWDEWNLPPNIGGNP